MGTFAASARRPGDNSWEPFLWKPPANSPMLMGVERPGDQTARRAARGVTLAAALIGAAVFLLTRLYPGLHGDARLYAFMALARTDPAALGADLFLKYGSQDAYSLFSPVFAAMIGVFGFNVASLVLMLASHLVWLTGVWLLTHRLVRGLAGHIAFLLAVAVNASYGGWEVLHAGEAVLTARPLAEGLTLIGLWLLLSRRWIGAAAALTLAALFHPAMALAGLAAAFVTLALKRPRLWWLVPVGAALGLGLAVAGVPPFAGALLIMDDSWLAGVVGHNGFVLPSSWLEADFARFAAELAICAAAALWTGGTRRRFFVAVSIAALAGLLVSLVGGDGLRDALVVQLQTWRLAWLMALAALPGLVVLALALRDRPAGWPATALLAAPLVILTRPFSDFAWAWIAAAVMSAAGLVLAGLIRQGRAPTWSAARSRIIVELACVLPLAAVVDSLVNFGEDLAFHARHGVFSLDPASFVGVRLILLAVALALLWLARRRVVVALSAAGAGLIVAATIWDARTPWDRFVETAGPSPIAAGLAPDGAILWGEEAAPTWFLLRRPAYVSATQAAGLLFARATAVEWARRAAIAAPLVPLAAWSPKSQLPTCEAREAPAATATIKGVCAQATGGLTAIVLDRPAAVGRSFTTPAAEPYSCTVRGRVEARWTHRLTLVRCADLAGR